MRRLTTATLIACLALFALLAPAAFADDPLASAASDPPAATEAPPADPAPASDPVAQDPAPPPADTPADQPSGPGPVIEPVSDPVTVDPSPIQSLPDPGTAMDLPPAALDLPAGDGPPARGGTPAAVDLPSPSSGPVSAPDAGAAPAASAPVSVAPAAGGVVIPEPAALAPAAWKWPAPVRVDGRADMTFTGVALSSAPPVLSVPSGVPPREGAAPTRHDAGAAPASSIVESLPDPWSPGAPGAPASAGSAAPGGAGGAFGGLFLASLFFVLLALAAPRLGLSRLAQSPVLALRPAYAPARAPPAS